ncbi:MAG: hypothetical protein ABI151_09075 [Chitinophagaceae bacterium]
MQTGVQFTGTVAANASAKWFTHSWQAAWHVVWYCVPVAPIVDGNAQIEWKVQVDRQAADKIKYFIEVKNLTGGPVSFEARYAIINI